MARYDVYKLEGKSTPYVLDVQANILDHLDSVVVVPLLSKKDAASEALERLKPLVEIEGTEFILITTDLSSIPRKTLGDYICNVEEDYAQHVTDALDFLFQGF